MKNILVLLMSAMLVGCAASGENLPATDKDVAADAITTPQITITEPSATEVQISDVPQGEIFVEVSPNNIKVNDIPDIISYTVTNLSEYTFWSGYSRQIEFFDGEIWVRAVDNSVYLPAYLFSPGESFNCEIATKPLSDGDFNHQNVWTFQDPLPAGLYRVNYYGHYGEFTIS